MYGRRIRQIGQKMENENYISLLFLRIYRAQTPTCNDQKSLLTDRELTCPWKTTQAEFKLKTSHGPPKTVLLAEVTYLLDDVVCYHAPCLASDRFISHEAHHQLEYRESFQLQRPAEWQERPLEWCCLQLVGLALLHTGSMKQ